MRIPLITAIAAVASAAVPALAAPPSCDKILDGGLRRTCLERVERCEPLKTAAERDDCYRGPRAPRGTPLATAGGPVPLVPAAPAPQAPAREAAVRPAPQPPVQTSPAPPPAAPHPTVAQPVVAAPPALPKAAVPPPRTAPAPAVARPAAPAITPEQVVRAFYDALSRADGTAANSALIPEKRGSSAYEPAAISRYYGALREPLRVLGISAREPGMVQVRYTYTHAGGRRCDGAAEVAVGLRGGVPLIERIKALNGC